MRSLDYSTDAKNVLNRFYRVDRMVYVEGDDDVPFWELLFEKIGPIQVEVRQVGGKREIAKYVDEVLAGELDAIVAMDADFCLFQGGVQDHSRILYTAGHSIENSLICAATLAKVARRTGKLAAKDAPTQEFQDWLEGFYAQISSLLVNDIIDQCMGSRIGVIGANADRFMAAKASREVSTEKVTRYLEEVQLSPECSLPKELVSRMLDHAVDLQDFLRGHFLFSAAYRCVSVFIKGFRPKFSLSHAAFFGALLLAFEGEFDSRHPHYAHYERQMGRLANVAS